MADWKSIVLVTAVALAGMNALAARSTAARSASAPYQAVQTDAHKPVTYHFAVTNTTDKPQTIESVRTSCACLKVDMGGSQFTATETDAINCVPPGGVLPFDADVFAARWGQRALPYLPDGVAVGGGAKWTLPKAGQVAHRRGTTEVDATRLGENPSALRLVYRSKDGSFWGTFKAYADMNGRPKATTVKVAGVLVNGTGYGMATVRGGGRAPVTIE